MEQKKQDDLSQKRSKDSEEFLAAAAALQSMLKKAKKTDSGENSDIGLSARRAIEVEDEIGVVTGSLEVSSSSSSMKDQAAVYKEPEEIISNKILIIAMLILVHHNLSVVQQSEKLSIYAARIKLIDPLSHKVNAELTKDLGRVLVAMLASTKYAKLIDTSVKNTWTINLAQVKLQNADNALNNAINSLLDSVNRTRSELEQMLRTEPNVVQMISVSFQLNGLPFSPYRGVISLDDNEFISSKMNSKSKIKRESKKRHRPNQDELSEHSEVSEGDEVEVMSKQDGSEEEYIPSKSIKRKLSLQDFPLHDLARQGLNDKIGDYLLEQNKEHTDQLFCEDAQGLTPLMVAVQANQFKAVRSLLTHSLKLQVLPRVLSHRAGNSVNIAQKDRCSALEQALFNNDCQSLSQEDAQRKLTNQTKTVQLLMKFGAPFTVLVKRSSSALRTRGKLELKRLLLPINNDALNDFISDTYLVRLSSLSTYLNNDETQSVSVLQELTAPNIIDYRVSLLNSAIVYDTTPMSVLCAMILHPNRNILCSVFESFANASETHLDLFKSLLLSTDNQNITTLAILEQNLAEEDQPIFSALEKVVGKDWLTRQGVEFKLFTKENGKVLDLTGK